jgi:glycosyltransferase involved in cell wall biosynthesis
MVEKWQEGYDVVVAKRRKRQDKFFKNITAKLFHKLFGYLTNNNLHPDSGDFRLLDKKVIQIIRQLPEKTRFMKGVFSWVGFKTAEVYFDRPQRAIGTTKIPFLKLFKLAFDGIFSFSTKPLKIWLYIGLTFSIISFIYASFLILRKLVFGTDLPGYTSLMVVILFMGGIQLISLGVIGEYIARIYKEVKNRPIYIVEKKYGFKQVAKKPTE